jgi:hypothetical protein
VAAGGTSGSPQTPAKRPLRRRARRGFLTLTTVLAVAAVLAPAGSSRSSALPTLYVAYTINCTFGITDDSGRKVTSIAPGTYQVNVTTPLVFSADMGQPSGPNDFTDCRGFVQFQLTGPGVNLSTTLQDGDEDHDILRATFQASASYTAQDNNQPSVTRTVFSTAATVSPTASADPSGTSKSSSSNGSSQPSLVGSGVVASRGNLAATIDPAGRLALKTKGRPVVTLKAGLYTFTVRDDSAKSGFSIQKVKANANAIALTGVAYKGTHVKTVQLKAGQWTFFSPGGKKYYFIVS